MTLVKKDIEKIAKLSRIELRGDDVEKYTTQINNILDMVSQLKEINTDNVPEMAGVGNFTMRTREADAVTDGNIQESVLKNAPKSQFGCFVVPKVVDAG